MCLGIPAKILAKKDGWLAQADFGGIKREISLYLCPEAAVGDYVLVHVGFAIQILEKDDALERLDLIETCIDAEQGGDDEAT